MAGIGFTLRKVLNHYSMTRAVAAYAVAGIVGGGPWLISVSGIIVLSYLINFGPEYYHAIAQFRITITYLVAGSTILSGGAGTCFSRYAADQIFLNRPDYIIPNLNGVMLIITTAAGIISFLVMFFLFQEQDLAYRFLFIANFVILSNVWVVISLLTGIKDYKIILYVFFISYSIIILLGYKLRNYGLDAFMFSFLIGHTFLLLSLLVTLYREFSTDSIIEFDFLKKKKIHKILIFSGCFFNLAIWIDKIIFWYSPSTSYEGIEVFRASLLYDFPIFLSYLFSLPAMATFILLIETHFSEFYAHFNQSIVSGKSLSYIQILSNQVASYAFNLIYSIIKIQSITVIIVFLYGPKILSLLHMSTLYYNVLYIAMIGSSLQILLLAIVDILYYMDNKRYVLILSITYFVLNLLFTLATIYLGPLYYGYGFTLALAVVCVMGMYFLNLEFENLEYKIIMLRENK